LTGFGELPSVRAATTGAEFSTLLDEVEASFAYAKSDLARERSDAAGLITVLAIDDLDGLQRSADSDALERLVRLIRARHANLHALLVGSSASFGASYDGVGHAIKESQTGFVVGGSDYEDLQVLGINVPHAEASQGLPPGRGFYVRRKRYVRVKIAEPPGSLTSEGTPLGKDR